MIPVQLRGHDPQRPLPARKFSVRPGYLAALHFTKMLQCTTVMTALQSPPANVAFRKIIVVNVQTRIKIVYLPPERVIFDILAPTR